MALKANQADVDAEMALKANQSDVDAEMELKAKSNGRGYCDGDEG